eukprot:1188294-Prorocentrum_minimum.AAC.2
MRSNVGTIEKYENSSRNETATWLARVPPSATTRRARRGFSPGSNVCSRPGTSVAQNHFRRAEEWAAWGRGHRVLREAAVLVQERAGLGALAGQGVGFARALRALVRGLLAGLLIHAHVAVHLEGLVEHVRSAGRDHEVLGEHEVVSIVLLVLVLRFHPLQLCQNTHAVGLGGQLVAEAGLRRRLVVLAEPVAVERGLLQDGLDGADVSRLLVGHAEDAEVDGVLLLGRGHRVVVVHVDVTGGLREVGVRAEAHRAAHDLLRAAAVPVRVEDVHGAHALEADALLHRGRAEDDLDQVAVAVGGGVEHLQDFVVLLRLVGAEHGEAERRGVCSGTKLAEVVQRLEHGREREDPAGGHEVARRDLRGGVVGKSADRPGRQNEIGHLTRGDQETALQGFFHVLHADVPDGLEVDLLLEGRHDAVDVVLGLRREQLGVRAAEVGDLVSEEVGHDVGVVRDQRAELRRVDGQ